MSEHRKTPDREGLKSRLSPLEYSVMFEQGTERPGSSPLLQEDRDGTFVCAACGEALFEAGTKFESGTRGPSVFDASPGKLGTRTETSDGMIRTEYQCRSRSAEQCNRIPAGT